MSTTYQGNPSTNQTPSAAPAPGVLPKTVLPADGDACNAASVAETMKVCPDYIAHIQSSVRLDVPVVNGGSTGFTAPSYVSFGGTVTPSGSVHTTDGTRFVIKCIVGGAVGVATFQTSTDGGTTFGATQTTAASMTDATSGITLAFSGTLTANGTATFRAAFTPQALWREVGSNDRFFVDHSGFSTGRFNQVNELWDWEAAATSFNTNQSPFTRSSRWAGLFGTGSGSNSLTMTAVSSTYAGRVVTMTPGTNGSDSCLIGTWGGTTVPASFLDLAIEFDFQMSAVGANNVGWALGLIAGLMPAGALPGNTNSGAWFEKASADTNWFGVTCNGTTKTRVDLGIAPSANTWQRFRIEYHGSSTGMGLGVQFLINDGFRLSTTTTPPLAGTLHSMQFYGVRAAANAVTGLLGVTRWANNLI